MSESRLVIALRMGLVKVLVDGESSTDIKLAAFCKVTIAL